MRHDLLPPPTTSLLPCAPPPLHFPSTLGVGDFDDLGIWLAACSSPVPVGATPTDLLEVDVHVHTQCDLLADPPFDWGSSASLTVPPLPLEPSPAKAESSLLLFSPHTLCPESPCSVALDTGIQLAELLLPKQLCGTQCGLSLDLLRGDLTLPSETDIKSLLDADDDGNAAANELVEAVKRELPTYSQPPHAPQPVERPWHAISTPGSGSPAVETSGKERIRKRQRAYEQKYRRKKRTNFKHMRREWLHLEMELFALQIQQAEAIPSVSAGASLREKLVQLVREEKALLRCLAQRQTAARWVEFFRIQLRGEEEKASIPRFPTSRHEWSVLVDAAPGIGACMPFVPAGFRFSWD